MEGPLAASLLVLRVFTEPVTAQGGTITSHRCERSFRLQRF